MAMPPRADMSDQFQIFQDAAFFPQASAMISNAPMPSVANPPPQRRLMQNTNHTNTQHNSNNANIIINPPLQPAVRQSPHKSATPLAPAAPLAPLKPSQGNKLNMVSFKPPPVHANNKPTDPTKKKQPVMSHFKTMAQKASMDAAGLNTAAFVGKENNHPIIFPAPPGLNVSIESYYQKPPAKRLLEPAPIKDGRPAKMPRLEEEPIPPHDSFPPIVDDGLKPGHSYAMLIGMAILRSPQRKLTLSQIYKWISDTYSFYNPQDAGWQNSIRHNLSLNKAFVKQERPKEDPGKGNYWAIEPGMESTFMKDKPIRKPPTTNDSLQVVTSTIMEPPLPAMPPMYREPALPPQLPPHPTSMAEPSSSCALPTTTGGHHRSHSTKQQQKQNKQQQQQELSSDATIIVSDSAGPEEDQANATNNTSTKNDQTTDILEPTDLTILDSSLYSPLQAAALHSSPPIARRIEAPSGTPTRAPRGALNSSVNRSRKRKSASMDDSGYISSLESSALRGGNTNTRHIPPEGSVDRSRIKRGRAEEEIARLRASSYDSPTKGRSRNGYHPNSSSPLRHNDLASNQMPPPPLTPAVKLKAPLKPPPSVSPGTNLRMHRDRVRHMLASPLRRIASASDDVQPWGSPTAFDESLYNFTDEADFSLDAPSLGSGFEIFQDDALPSFFPNTAASPLKQPSNKRLRMDRPHSVSALSDVTNSAARRSITSAPFLKVPNQSQSPGVNLDTPSKFFDNLPSSPSRFFSLQSPSKMPSNGVAPVDENSWVPLDEFCSTDFLQDVDDFGGLDILQGFEKIGANVPPQQLFSVPPQPRLTSSQQPRSKGSKPALGRSYTSTF